ncbi:MAG: cytochrome c oxidase accessory protein CcoG, partial [Candidatus Neomarinimicrobiota bacterium]
MAASTKSQASGEGDTGGYRDRLTTIDDSGRRAWIYPHSPQGPFHTARLIVNWLLIAALIAGPFIKVNGQPIILLDILNRKFILFGLVFWPQDFHLFVLAMLAAIVFMLLFTAVYGRIFCGWLCPQTIFMEMVFRKIEYLIEGDAHRQRTRNQRPWDLEKFIRKGLKHLVFWGISFFFGNILLAYVIGLDTLLGIIADSPLDHLMGLASMTIFSGVFYFVFAWFREQVCTLVCPYGRLQAVLLDERSVVISYDYIRGEPRGKSSGGRQAHRAGDCVDCGKCVHVCPTGIDIRNGTQLECINCTACIDACNHVMTRLGRPHGLIRYASHKGILNGGERWWTPRMAGYSAVLILLLGAIVGLVALRGDVETTVLRTPGLLYQEKPGNLISNLYTAKIVNKTTNMLPLELRLIEPSGILSLVGGAVTLPAGELAQLAFFIDIDRG